PAGRGGPLMSETLGMPATMEKAELAGQVAFVTGGATGIGLAVSKLLAARGASVAIFNRSQDKARAAVDDLRKAGRAAHAYAADVADAASVETAFDQALADLE